MVSVTVGGYTPEALLDVDDQQKGGGELSKAVITVGSTPSNRSALSDGDEVVIQRGGETTFTGYVMGRPSQERDGTIKVEAMDKRLELKHENVNRTFYNTDSGEVIRRAVTTEAEPLDTRRLFDASTLGDWSSDAPVFELYTEAPADADKTDVTQMWEYGTDMVFVGFREGSSGEYYVRRENLPSDGFVSPGGGLQKAFTRMLVNDRGEQFDVEFELSGPNGTQYLWELSVRGSDFERYELETAEASAAGETGTDLTAEYRFTISGELSEDRGVFIDSAHTGPYTETTRDTGLTVNNVQTTGRKITRRVDLSVMELLQDLSEEDQHDFWVDENDDLHYEPSGGESRPDRPIIEGTTPVVGANFDRNAEQVRNKVIVQGSEDVQVTVRNPASIEFYGVNARTEPLVDTSLQTRAEAEARGRGYLEEHAWDSDVATFEIADSSYRDVGIGDSLPVVWDSQDVNGNYTVRDREIDRAGIVTLSMGVSVRGA